MKLRKGTTGGAEGRAKLLRLDAGELPVKFGRTGVEGIEDGGSGNRESPRLMVLSAIAEALVSTEAAETCRDTCALCF